MAAARVHRLYITLRKSTVESEFLLREKICCVPHHDVIFTYRNSQPGVVSTKKNGRAAEKGTTRGHVFVLVRERKTVNNEVAAKSIMFALHHLTVYLCGGCLTAQFVRDAAVC